MNRVASIKRRLAGPTLIAAMLLTGALLPLASSAAPQPPEIVVRELFTELLGELDALRTEDTLTPANARKVFARLLSPRIDYSTLSRWILREYWTNSSDDQRARFLSAFKDYIVNTYSLALSGIQQVALDVENDPTLRKNTAIVDAQLRVDGEDAVPLQFRMIERDNRWNLFDVSFAGVSLALTFRSDFTYVADEGGIEAVIAHLLQRAGSD